MNVGIQEIVGIFFSSRFLWESCCQSLFNEAKNNRQEVQREEPIIWKKFFLLLLLDNGLWTPPPHTLPALLIQEGSCLNLPHNLRPRLPRDTVKKNKTKPCSHEHRGCFVTARRTDGGRGVCVSVSAESRLKNPSAIICAAVRDYMCYSLTPGWQSTAGMLIPASQLSVLSGWFVWKMTGRQPEVIW